jgi:hypothetical protein
MREIYKFPRTLEKIYIFMVKKYYECLFRLTLLLYLVYVCIQITFTCPLHVIKYWKSHSSHSLNCLLNRFSMKKYCVYLKNPPEVHWSLDEASSPTQKLVHMLTNSLKNNLTGWIVSIDNFYFEKSSKLCTKKI